jgi:peptide deformylase
VHGGWSSNDSNSERKLKQVSVLPIYTYGQQVLKKKARLVRAVDERLRRFAGDMMETMYNSHGIGLAANQVGTLERMIVVDVSDMEEMKDLPEGAPGKTPLVLLNPEVISEEGSWFMEEGCLSIPEIREEVERAEKIRLHYRDLEFAERELDAEGMLGRVLLHEIDHLNGILFIDRLNLVKRKLLRGRLNKIRRGEMEVMYPIVAEEPQLK